VISNNPAYLEAGKVIPWVVMGMYARGFYFVFVMAIYYSKKLRWLPVITVVASLVNIGLNLIFVPRFGYMAAAVNTMAAFILQTILVFVYAQKCYYLNYNYKQFMHLIVIFLTINCVLWYLISFDEIIWFIAKFLLVISFPLVLFITGFFSKTELAWALKSIRYFNRSHWNKLCQSQKYR
jgi:peptidoglycan biosynthesis protein MviN/MurJ (putative lipid II flippase)